MFKLVGLLVIGFLAAFGLYTLLNSNEKDLKKTREKIERAYDAAKKELKK